jgi:hypothetical protein
MNYFLFPFSNIFGEQQVNNTFYNCIDSAPDTSDAETVSLGLDMANKMNKI